MGSVSVRRMEEAGMLLSRYREQDGHTGLSV